MLSVVLPTRNDRKSVEFLIYTLLAVLEEPTGGDFELVVVDDSNDGSDAYLAEKMRRFAGKVDVWHREKGTGLATAIGDGIERCRGDQVLLMDADFNHDPHDLPRLLELKRSSGCDLASGSRSPAVSAYFSFAAITSTDPRPHSTSPTRALPSRITVTSVSECECREMWWPGGVRVMCT